MTTTTQSSPPTNPPTLPPNSIFQYHGGSNSQTITFNFTSGDQTTQSPTTTPSTAPPTLIPNDDEDHNPKKRRVSASKRKRGTKNRTNNGLRIHRSKSKSTKNFSFPITCPFGPVERLPLPPPGNNNNGGAGDASPVVPEWYTASVPLGVKDDKSFLYGLDTYLRANLFEVFGADEAFVQKDILLKERPPGSQKAMSFVGRVGIRCRFCHGSSSPSASSTADDYGIRFPSKISDLYHCAQTLFHAHFPTCPHVPSDDREVVEALQRNHKGNLGPREWYWEDSARMLGMVDCGGEMDGVYFGRDPSGVLPKLRGASAVYMSYDEDCMNTDTKGTNKGNGGLKEKQEDVTKHVAGRPILKKLPALPYIYTGGDIDHSSGNVPKDVVYVIVHDSITHIDGCAFQNCKSLASIQLSDSVKSIGVKAFEGCTNLTSVRFPPGLKFIGHEAFSGCVCLTEVRLPEGLERIENGAFYRCESLTKVETVVDIADVVMEDNDTGLGAGRCRNLPNDHHVDFTALVASNLHALGKDAFTFCTSLIKVTLPSRITTFGERAFFGCDALKSVQLPSKLIGFPVNAFEGCTVLDTINGLGSPLSEWSKSSSIIHIIPDDDSDDDNDSDNEDFNDSNNRPSTQLTPKLHKALTAAGYSTLNLSNLLQPNPNAASQPATHYYHSSIWSTWTRMVSPTDGRIPLVTAVAAPCSDWESVGIIFRKNMPGIYENDVGVSGLPPFGLAAAGEKGNLEVAFRLLREYPPAITGCGRGWSTVEGVVVDGDGAEDMDWDDL